MIEWIRLQMSSSSIGTSSCFKLKAEGEAWIQNSLGVCNVPSKKKKKKEWIVLCSCFSVGSSYPCLCANDDMCVLISPSHVPIEY